MTHCHRPALLCPVGGLHCVSYSSVWFYSAALEISYATSCSVESSALPDTFVETDAEALTIPIFAEAVTLASKPCEREVYSISTFFSFVRLLSVLLRPTVYLNYWPSLDVMPFQ